MTERTLDFWHYSCHMSLNMPVAMEEMPLTNLRKFLKLMDADRWRNEENIRTFFTYIPEITEDLKAKWDEASLNFQRDYLDPKYSAGNYIDDKDEREKRRNHNKRLLNKVKAAKARYERFQRRVPKLEELKEQYT